MEQYYSKCSCVDRVSLSQNTWFSKVVYSKESIPYYPKVSPSPKISPGAPPPLFDPQVLAQVRIFASFISPRPCDFRFWAQFVGSKVIPIQLTPNRLYYVRALHANIISARARPRSAMHHCKKKEVSHQRKWIQLVSYSTWISVVIALQYFKYFNNLWKNCSLTWWFSPPPPSVVHHALK